LPTRISLQATPFNIRNFNSNLVVTYAKQDADKEDDVAGPGFGFIDVFNTHGQLLRRLVSQGTLNAPWGLEIVNSALWVGNFGDGRINVYNPTNGSFLCDRETFSGSPFNLRACGACC
jgi:uncharacterized protein (TIGR03118 family)